MNLFVLVDNNDFYNELFWMLYINFRPIFLFITDNIKSNVYTYIQLIWPINING